MRVLQYFQNDQMSASQLVSLLVVG